MRIGVWRIRSGRRLSRRMRAVICWNAAASSWKPGRSTWTATGPDRVAGGLVAAVAGKRDAVPAGWSSTSLFRRCWGDVCYPVGTDSLSCAQASKARSRSLNRTGFPEALILERMKAMGRSNRYAPEVRDRAVRLVSAQRGGV